MAWTYNDTIVRAGRSWTDDNGVTHPSNWMQWSDEQKTSAGLVEVEDPAWFDNRFYWSAGIAKNLHDSGESLGLRSTWKSRVDETAGSLLSSTDWYVVRKSETGAEIPTDVSDYRTAVRQANTDIKADIDASTDMDAFIDVVSSMNWPVDSSQVV